MRTTIKHPLRTAAALTSAAAVLLLLVAGPASAHVDPDPLAIQTGSSATVAFGVEHGCANSPTIEVDIKFPDGYTDIKAVDKQGWTTKVDGNVVTFTGGSLDSKTADHFDVSVTAPAAAGDTPVPVVQKCKVGQINWIEIAKEGEKEPEHPAAPLKVTAGPPTADDLKPANDAASADAGAKSSNSSSKAPWVIAGIAAAVVAGVGTVMIRRKRATESKTAV